ncbi:MAG: ATP-binding protein [Gemmatimonadota bacterium]
MFNRHTTLATFSGRSRELGYLRTVLDSPEPTLVRVTGLPRVGKSEAVQRAVGGRPVIFFTAPPLPAPDQRRALASVLNPGSGTEALGESPRADGEVDGPPPWHELLGAVRSAFASASHGPRSPIPVLVVDDAHRLVQARARFFDALRAAMADPAAEVHPFHCVLVAPVLDLPSPHRRPPPLRRDVSEPAESHLSLPPLSFRGALPFLPGRTPRERLLAYSVFGGLPGTLAHLDPGAGLNANLRRVVLSPTAPLSMWGLHLLERFFQSPPRYAAALRTLSRGEAEWHVVRTGISDLTGSGQVAPYLKRLQALGAVGVRRSLDARKGGRSRRYHIPDPFLAFWFRFLLEPGVAGEATAEARTIPRADLEVHAATVFPSVCRAFMEHDAMEVLGANARESGSLWGPGYDLPVAGVLTSGAAYYGKVYWRKAPDPDDLAELDAAIRETRYGFGRERRLRILFSARGFSAALTRAAARRDDVILIGARELAGS